MGLAMVNSLWLMMAVDSLSGTMHIVKPTHTLAGNQVCCIFIF